MASDYSPFTGAFGMEKETVVSHIVEKAAEMAQLGFFASLGAMAAYLRQSVIDPKGRKFRWVIFLANIVVAFVVGNLVGDFLDGHEYKDGLLIAAGYACFPVLDIVEMKIRKFAQNFAS